MIGLDLWDDEVYGQPKSVTYIWDVADDALRYHL